MEQYLTVYEIEDMGAPTAVSSTNVVGHGASEHYGAFWHPTHAPLGDKFFELEMHVSNSDNFTVSE